MNSFQPDGWHTVTPRIITSRAEELVRFVKEEALQGNQLAANMWTRAITSSPQITSYYLGYRKVRQAYDAARTAAGVNFDLQKFMDGMMELGPVPLERYIDKFNANSAKIASPAK